MKKFVLMRHKKSESYIWYTTENEKYISRTWANGTIIDYNHVDIEKIFSIIICDVSELDLATIKDSHKVYESEYFPTYAELLKSNPELFL